LTEKNPLEAEELLGARGRVRILQVLAESGETYLTELARRTGLNHNSVQRHLEKLKEMGVVREKRFGRIRIFEAVFKTLTVRFESGRGVTVETEPPDKT
jgi:DNA-binding transcriptional ArsR family regulator